MNLRSLQKSKEGEPFDHSTEPVRIQAHSLGKRGWLHIGRGQQGPIEVDMYQPQKPDKAQALDESTGEVIFVASHKAEQATEGLIVRDFLKVAGLQLKAIDRANVAGAQFENVKHSSREHWPIEKEATPEFSLKQLTLGGFQTNVGDRYQRRWNAWLRLQEIRRAAKVRRGQPVDDGVLF